MDMSGITLTIGIIGLVLSAVGVLLTLKKKRQEDGKAERMKIGVEIIYERNTHILNAFDTKIKNPQDPAQTPPTE